MLVVPLVLAGRGRPSLPEPNLEAAQLDAAVARRQAGAAVGLRAACLGDEVSKDRQLSLD